MSTKEFKYNPKYYNEGKLLQLRPKGEAIHTYQLSDGTLIGMFQGSRGTHKDLDFIVRLLRVGENQTPFPPPHLFWVTDLIIKAQLYPNEVKEIVSYYIDFYEKRCVPFNTKEERLAYTPKTVEHIKEKYSSINVPQTLPIDYIALVVELFCYCEKRNEGAFMFKELLLKIKDYTDGHIDYMDLLQGFK